MHSILISVLATCFAAGTSALSVASEPPIPGYGIETLQWIVPASTSGPEVALNGTVEEVYAQLLKLNPSYEAKLGSIDASRTLKTRVNALAKRGDVHCGGFSSASRYRIEQGVSYLFGVGGNPTQGPGPGNCGRVSCSWDSAIWWCNDNTFTKVLPGFYNIANGAQELLNGCGGDPFSGQLFVNGARDWNVIVRGDSC